MSDYSDSVEWTRICFIKNNILLRRGIVGISISGFCDLVGHQFYEHLLKIKNGEQTISRELAESINNICPSCTLQWIENGEGNEPDTPIPTSFFENINPWWPDGIPSKDALDAPIYGRWRKVKSFICHVNNYPPKWEQIPNPQPEELCDLRSFVFRTDGTMMTCNGDNVLETVRFGFDRNSGRLAIGVDNIMVAKITKSEMICYDWSDLSRGVVNKDYFIRI